MSLMAGDIGSMLRAQQSAQADRQQAGQAVQNMNVMCQLPETRALEQRPLFP